MKDKVTCTKVRGTRAGKGRASTWTGIQMWSPDSQCALTPLKAQDQLIPQTQRLLLRTAHLFLTLLFIPLTVHFSEPFCQLWEQKLKSFLVTRRYLDKRSKHYTSTSKFKLKLSHKDIFVLTYTVKNRW